MIWPAIDLINGQCVRLHKGDFSQTSLYDTDPIDRACQFADAGATNLHIVDLDGAKKGSPCQSKLICSIATATGLNVQAGGGVRSQEDIEALLIGGVSRVIIGSLAVTSPQIVNNWMREFGPENLVLALDVRVENQVPIPAISGWQETVNTSLWQVLQEYEEWDVNLLVTDIDRDGVLGGSNTELYAQIKRGLSNTCLLASGGIGCLDDVKRARASGADGVIIGKALYEDKFTLEEALSCWPAG